jgi:ribosome-associated translation inhibitor RaiA
MMIEKLHYSSRTTEVDGSATQIVNAYQQSTLNTDENMVKIFALIIDALALLSSAINRLKAKSEQVYYDDNATKK